MNTLENCIQKLKPKNFSFPVKDILTESFQLWSKILFLGIFSMLFTFSLISLGMLLCNNYWNISSIDNEFLITLKNIPLKNTYYNNINSTKEIWNIYYNYFSNPYIIIRFIILLVIKILISPLYSGVIYCAYKYDKFEKASFNDLISGFEGKRYFNLIVLNTIYLIIMICSIIFMYIPMIFFAPAFTLAGAFVAIHNISAFKAIKYSTKIAYINFGKMFFLTFIIFLTGNFLGTLLMSIYAFIFTIPFSLVIIYIIYKKIIGYNFFYKSSAEANEK